MMAEKGHTSSITSVTEENSIIDSESDTTESSYSNVTSSALSSTDTDEKLTPSLLCISITSDLKKSNINCNEKNAHFSQVAMENKEMQGNQIWADAGGDTYKKSTMKSKDNLLTIREIKHQGISLPPKRTVVKRKYTVQHKDRNLLQSVRSTPRTILNLTNNAASCRENLGVDDTENKLSTDFSDTSSVVHMASEVNEQSHMEEEDITDGYNDLKDPKKLFSWEPDMSSSCWYQARCFDHYWQHYSFVMAWYRAHMDAVHRLHKDAASMNMWGVWMHPNSKNGVGLQPSSHQVRQRKSAKNCRKARKARKKAKQRARAHSVSGAATGRTDKDITSHASNALALADTPARIEQGKEEAKEEEEEMEMEITDDMMAFFTTSMKHRMERDSAKLEDAEGKNTCETRVNIENATAGQSAPTTAPPQERPGARRALEMKQLYGAGAPMIHGMETALQMTFDRTQDKFQPKLWPNMPLKIVFG